MEQTENKDYDGFADIGSDQFDANESTPKNIPVPVETEELTEDFGDDYTEEDLSDKLSSSRAFHSFHSALVSSAKDGTRHHEILNALDKHIPKVPHPDDDKLNHILRSAPVINSDVHSQVFDILQHHANETQTNRAPGKARDSMDLIHKYAWALHHSPNTPPEQQHREDSYLAEDHIKKYSKDFQFRGGRVMSHNIIGSNHYLNHDGSHSIVAGTYDQRFPNELPHISDNYSESDHYHKDELENLHTPYIKDSTAREGIINIYTEDSKHINKTAAELNKGNGDPLYDGHDNNDLDVIAMHKAVVGAPAYGNKFTVFTGLSKSTNPKVAEESSPGKKTVHMKAFTSTSLHEPTARSFAVPFKKDPEIHQNIHDMLEINVPANHKGGVYVDRASQNKGEQEYILDHGTRIEHDAEPKYFAHNDRIFRVWKNGTIVGNKKHDDFSIEKKDPEEHTPAYVTRLQQSQLSLHNKWAAASPAATNKHLNTALEDQNHSVRFNAASNINASSENLKKAIKDPNYMVGRAALDNPNATEEHLKLAQDHADFNVRAKVAKHPLATPEMLSRSMKDESVHVRAEAVQNPNIAKEDLEAATKDKAPMVKQIAKAKTGVFNEEIIELMLKASEILKEG